MGELADEQNEQNKQSVAHLRGFPGSRPLPEHDPLAHLNGHAPQVDPVAYREATADHIVEFDDPVICIGHDRGMRYYFRKA